MSDKTQALDKATPAAPAVAFEKARQKLLAEMTEPTQQIAQECDTMLDKGNRGITRTFYNIGARMVEALDEAKQGEYGSNAAKQLASYISYFEGDTNKLYNLRQVAITFDEAFVNEYSEKKIGKGEHMSIEHWVQLSRIAKPAERQKMLDAVVTHGLSAAEVARRIRSGEVQAKNIRGGGRRVAPPSSLLSGLEKLRADSLKVTNYLKMCDKHVFGKIASMAVADFSDTLVAKLEADKAELATLRTKLDEADKSIDACLVRGKKALSEKEAKKAAEAKAAKAGKATPAKPAAKPAKPKAAKPKIKAKRPAAATASA